VAPPAAAKPGPGEGAGADDDDDAENEDSASLLANDLALQRLIAESHILSASGAGLAASSSVSDRADAFAEGRARRVTTDMRLRGLGSRDSFLTQAKMPMAMRRGIAAAAAARETKRRREARENGIVLERPAAAKTKARRGGHAAGAVDRPAVGKMRGAELRLSRRDILTVEGPRRAEMGRRGGRRGNGKG
jgi:hypothetical protein